MSAGPAGDRLAVWTFVKAGEEVVYGEPWVTDAERAAAGRETVAERWQALLPANRSRAAERFAAGGLPGDEDLVRVWQPRDPAALRARLGEAPLTAWSEADVLHVLWRGTADAVTLAAGVQPQLWPVEGAETGTAPRPGQAVSYRWPESAGPCMPGSSTRWCTFG